MTSIMKHIIHVDNSGFFRKQMKVFLQSEGFMVEGFDSALEANMTIAAGGADMIIVGLAFAGIEGEEFVNKIVSTFSGPVIVISSSVDKVKEERLLALGVHAAINKSISWKESLRPYLAELRGSSLPSGRGR